ncbi:molybdate ABC transporter substrate-binding protein [Corynebacterium sp. AOP40-9SA-29]|uniref:molybdate ABC transporter substrate-binding protein n=1 Tax=Corynebacterium sp. AOP40-9SA-29 TaxID=3457677 RepID=UPI0040334A6F
MAALTTRILRTTAVLAGAGGLVLAAACSTSGSDGSEPSSVQVFAAASLNNAGDELAEAFADEQGDDADITYNFAGSSALVQQIDQGADADVFISADEKNMDDALALDAFDGAEPEVIATNQLVLATAPGNPANITALDDLATTADARLAICADGVPCGTLAHQLLEDKGYDLANWTVSEEANVSDVATKVSTGEVDAGFMYATDAMALQKNSSEDITVVELDEDLEPNAYPAALTVDGQDNETAVEFLEWLSSDTARGILETYGFDTP